MSSFTRKQKKTYNVPGHAHFLTFSCHQRLPLLSRDRTRLWFLEALEQSRKQFEYELWAYVIMPEHAHLLIYPRNRDYQIERILASLKRPVSVKAKRYLLDVGNVDWLRRLTAREGLEEVFRFWQPGGGHDRNLWNDKPVEEVIE